MSEIKIVNLKKYYGVRLLLDIDELSIHDGDKIGIVGVNGVGKTTLLDMINGSESIDEGSIMIKKDTNIAYVPQLGPPFSKYIGGKYASIFQTETVYNNYMSGGEKTRFKLAVGFESEPDILLVDEPTSNLDIDGIGLIIDNFKPFNKTILVISHDRHFLDEVCDKILEIRDTKCKLYNGNYSKYIELKEMELARNEFEYSQYIKEKERLTRLKYSYEEQSRGIGRTLKRMGNSEARLHKMGGQINKNKVDKLAKAVESRIEKLEVIEKPKEESVIRIKVLDSTKPGSKILISAENLNKSFGEKIIFEDANFSVFNGKVVALIGPNGSGKTTLVNMILNNDGIVNSKALKIGHFSQSLDILDESKSILENVMDTSIHNEDFARLVLARLLIRGEKVYENLSILSGGERVKVSFAKMILSNINCLILDEPTNFLDISSLKVIEEVLQNYDGTVLLVTHDVKLIDAVADELLIIKDRKLISHLGNYSDYIESCARDNASSTKSNQKMLLEIEISRIISELSLDISNERKEELEKELELKSLQLRKYEEEQDK